MTAVPQPIQGAAPSEPVLCRAHTTRGKPCRNLPMNAAPVCRMHGGGAPQVRRAAERRQQEQRVRALIKLYEADFDPETVDPTFELLRMVWTAGLVERVTRDQVRSLLGEEWLTQVSYGVQGKRTEVHPLVRLWHETRDQVAKFAKAAIDAGIAERQVQLTEEMAGMMATKIRVVIFNVDLRLEPWQQQRILDDLATGLLAA